jgi:mono/diheme cytochrome c family protein
MKQAILAFVAVLALAGCSMADRSQPPLAERLTMADAARGQHLAETHCATCHAIGPDGVSPHGEAPPFRTLSRRYPISSLEEAFAEGVLVGHPDMPRFQLEPSDVDALIAYMYTVQEAPER